MLLKIYLVMQTKWCHFWLEPLQDQKSYFLKHWGITAKRNDVLLLFKSFPRWKIRLIKLIYHVLLWCRHIFRQGLLSFALFRLGTSDGTQKAQKMERKTIQKREWEGKWSTTMNTAISWCEHRVIWRIIEQNIVSDSNMFNKHCLWPKCQMCCINTLMYIIQRENTNCSN